MPFANKKVNLAFWIAGLVAIGLMASTAKAATPDLGQPLSVNWTVGSAPTTFYEYGQKLSYRFTITSNSNQVQYVHVFAEAYADPARVFQASMLTRTYKLLPRGKINLLFQAYAPDEIVLANPEFKMDASIAAEGYPSLHIGADAWHNSGK